MYENVEKQRRRALDNMLSLTELDSKAIRERIGYYLQRSEFDELLDDISDPDAHNQGINKLIETMDLVSDYERAESLRGTSSRFLESYATQPTLLMLRGMAEACVKTPDQDTASRDFHAGLTEWITQYQLSFEDLTTSLVEFLIYFEKSKPKIHQFVIDALLTSSVMNRDLARKFALMLPKNTSVPFMVWLAQNLAKETGQFTQVR